MLPLKVREKQLTSLDYEHIETDLEGQSYVAGPKVPVFHPQWLKISGLSILLKKGQLERICSRAREVLPAAVVVYRPSGFPVRTKRWSQVKKLILSPAK